MNKRIKIFSGKFLLAMALYAVCFGILAWFGLRFFWQFIEAYEASRPKHAIEAYMEQLSPEHMCAASDDLYATVDPKLQTREQFDQVICDALEGSFSYAKKSSKSTEERQVFAVRSGRVNVGEFAITAGEEDRFGFRCWDVESFTYDFAYLMGQSVGVTVPSEFQVSVNGHVLSKDYIVQEGIRYDALEGFYESYALPTMVTYHAEGFLGEGVLEVRDPQGDLITITPETDMDQFLPTCSEEENAEAEAFAREFIDLWVAFSSSTKYTSRANYHKIVKVLSTESELAALFYTALEGLSFGQSNATSVVDVQINRIMPLEDGRILCDVTYVASTVGRQGPVEMTSFMKMMLVREDGVLKLEAMERY